MAINPHYLVKSKLPIEPSLPSRAVLHANRIPSRDPATPSLTTESFAKYAEAAVMHDFKESCCEASVNMYSDAQVASRGSKLFEFPDGYNDYYAARPRMSVPEVFFNPANFLPRDVSLCPSSLAFHSQS